MVNVAYNPLFEKIIGKLKDKILIKKVKDHIKRIIDNPDIGKPMRYDRKGTRELYIKSFRLSYAYLKQEDKIIFLDLYHKDEQ